MNRGRGVEDALPACSTKEENMKAMLFNELEGTEEDLIEMLRMENVVVQQKMDGVRVLARAGATKMEFTQRDGKPVKFAAAAQWLRSLDKALDYLVSEGLTQYVLDGELMIATGEYRVFDVYVDEVPTMAYRTRLAVLTTLTELIYSPQVVLVSTQYSHESKVALMEAVRREGGEGVMIKSLDAAYEPGKRVNHSAKVKFVKDADVIVTKVDRPDPKHGSATLAVKSSGGDLITVGSSSLIGKSTDIAVGDVLQVRYLYNSGTLEKPTMYQPRIIAKRTDKWHDECTTAQFQTYTRHMVDPRG